MPMDMIMFTVAVVLILIGLLGVILPAVPGAPLVFVGLLIASAVDDFTRVGWVTLTILGVLMLASMGIDFITTAYGAKKVGASRLALVGAVVGFTVGLFFGPPGFLLGPFIGAFCGEFITRQEVGQAAYAGFGATLGLLLGIAFKIAIVFTMLGVFITSFFFL